MKVSDLRSGNYVSTPEETPHEWGWGYDFEYWDIERDIEPIPLTEEWFLKFGGIPDESNDIYLPLPHGIDMRLYIKYDHLLLCKGQVCPLFEYEHIKYIHQLQNLYFVLIGEELCLK